MVRTRSFQFVPPSAVRCGVGKFISGGLIFDALIWQRVIGKDISLQPMKTMGNSGRIFRNPRSKSSLLASTFLVVSPRFLRRHSCPLEGNHHQSFSSPVTCFDTSLRRTKVVRGSARRSFMRAIRATHFRLKVKTNNSSPCQSFPFRTCRMFRPPREAPYKFPAHHSQTAVKFTSKLS